LEGNGLPEDDAGDLAAHDDLSARDHPGHFSLLADDDLGGLNVTFNLAIDLLAPRLFIAYSLDIILSGSGWHDTNLGPYTCPRRVLAVA
jgi:hypothetical protein